MPAYLIVNIVVKDPETYEQYKKGVPPYIAKYGGEYLARGGKCEVMEGDWTPSRLVLVRFPDAAAAKAFLDDPGYAPIRELRLTSTKSDTVILEGI